MSKRKRRERQDRPAHMEVTWAHYNVPAPRHYVKHPPPPVLEPIKGEIVAWRGWRLRHDHGGVRLWSTTWDVSWDGPTLTAHMVPAMDDRNVHAMLMPLWVGGELPAFATAAGVYALRPEAFRESTYAHLPVIGQVALTGVVVEGDSGYRAERATIRSLYLNVPNVSLEDGLRDFSEQPRSSLDSTPPEGCLAWAASVLHTPDGRWPEDVSPFMAVEELSRRYDVDVSLDPPEIR